MNRRVVVLAAVVVTAVAVVGLSAAATTSIRGEPSKAAKLTPARQGEAGHPVSTSTGQQQSPEDLARYWTKERMEGAKPLSKSVVGGSRPSAALPSDPGRTTPAVAPQTQANSKKPQKRKTAAPAEGPAGQAADNTGNADGYWTQDRMDKANPLEKSPSGDGGSGSSSGLPGSGGSTTPPPAIP